MEVTATCSNQSVVVEVAVVVRLFRDFQIFGFSALLATSPLCVARKLITLYFAKSTTLSINNLYPMVMTGLVNGLRIMSRMVMEENFNRDIQRGVIETKHVYFRQNAIIRPLQKCDNNAKQNNRILISEISQDNKDVTDGHDNTIQSLETQGMGKPLNFGKAWFVSQSDIL